MKWEGADGAVIERAVFDAPDAGVYMRKYTLDDNTAPRAFAETLERVVVETVEAGHMTKDLALLVEPDQGWLTSMGFLETVDENLNRALTG